MKILLVALCFALASALPAERDYAVLSQEIVDYINSLNTTWKAAPSKRFEGATEEYIRGLCGAKEGGPKLPEGDITVRADIPKSFDAREQWPNCPSITDIRDQGSCGSCWVSTYEDVPLCILMRSTVHDNFSVILIAFRILLEITCTMMHNVQISCEASIFNWKSYLFKHN